MIDRQTDNQRHGSSNTAAILTITGSIVAGELLEICRLKALMIAVHSPHHTGPRLLKHLITDHTHTGHVARSTREVIGSRWGYALKWHGAG